MDKKRKREEIKRMTKGVPGNYVQNQKSQVFEDRRTKRNRTRTDKKRTAFRDYREEIKNEGQPDDQSPFETSE